MLVLGIDGCKAGWIGIALDENGSINGVHAGCLKQLIDKLPNATVIAVDIPIGCEPNRFRTVDDVARGWVGRARSNSVFSVPPIDVFRMTDHESACKRCRELTGKALSRQSFALA